MSAEPALLSAIRDRPDDDTPRLAYADWLDDAGDAARAEFVRVQVQLARLPDHDPTRPALEDREHDLLATHEPAWLGVPLDALIEWEWERGFVNWVHCAELSRYGAGLFQRHPIRGLKVVAFSPDMPTFLRDWGDWVESLELQGWCWSGTELDQFLANPEWGRLSDLTVMVSRGLGWLSERADRLQFRDRIRRFTVNDAPIELRLAEVVEFIDPAPLAELGVPYLQATAPDLRELFERPAGRSLVRLDVSDTDLPPTALSAFARPAPALAALDLSATPLAAFALESLLASPALTGLRELSLNRCGSAANVVRALLGSPFWRQATTLRLTDGTVPTRLIEPLFAADGPAALRTLDLSNNYLYDAGIADLCNASWTGSLAWLGLGRNYLTDDAAERIARSGRFRHLRTLHLSYNHPRWHEEEDFAGQVTDRGAVALAASPGLAALRILTLTGVNLTAAGVDALINGPFWRLAGLGLGDCNLTAAAVKVLAASPRLARLSFLDLSRNRALRDEDLRPLAESPYLSPLLELDIHGTGASDGVREELRRRLGRRLGA
ncbi:MAG TPA: TIGR02996 domain-containing protein [Urbifossiella sp.]|jgi:uncharacterized protein (TIGR02996 family)|nr:TIGR02996 domain-containing protein [Urbifossiella sp.]